METITRWLQRDWFFWFARTAFLIYARIWHRLTIRDAHLVPREGGLVVAANHFSSLDPPILGVSIPREAHFMAKKELFENRYLRALVLGLRAYPVDRERSDIGAIKQSLRKLADGLVVGIFAQGTRNAGDREALDGAAFLAIRSGSPLQPAAIWREGRRFFVRFGEPIDSSAYRRQEAPELTRRLMAGINELLPADRQMSVPSPAEPEPVGRN